MPTKQIGTMIWSFGKHLINSRPGVLEGFKICSRNDYYIFIEYTEVIVLCI